MARDSERALRCLEGDLERSRGPSTVEKRARAPSAPPRPSPTRATRVVVLIVAAGAALHFLKSFLKKVDRPRALEQGLTAEGQDELRPPLRRILPLRTSAPRWVRLRAPPVHRLMRRYPIELLRSRSSQRLGEGELSLRAPRARSWYDQVRFCNRWKKNSSYYIKPELSLIHI